MTASLWKNQAGSLSAVALQLGSSNTKTRYGQSQRRVLDTSSTGRPDLHRVGRGGGGRGGRSMRLSREKLSEARDKLGHFSILEIEELLVSNKYQDQQISIVIVFLPDLICILLSCRSCSGII